MPRTEEASLAALFTRQATHTLVHTHTGGRDTNLCYRTDMTTNLHHASTPMQGRSARGQKRRYEQQNIAKKRYV